MRIVPTLIVSVLLGGALLQAACTRASVSDAVAGVARNDSMSEPAGTARLYGGQGDGFAALPDRGDLLGYPPRQVVRQERASTWYRADVSEEHALRAVVTGEMTITAPDGQPIRLRYLRHFEHPNGNWTWIGRNEHGEDAVVTFGEKAVFGSVPRDGNRELRLVTSGGHAWVVETDPGKEHHPDARRPDYMVPPELATSFTSDEPVTASASVEALATAAAGTTVDLVLGYTTGFANELGGNSQAVTRLQNLVDITNQAYSNSRINARIRLVRTVSVSYRDDTDNNDALEKLSGKSESGSIPADPAFTALRAARDQYGADLVSLVRRFRTPQNEGCGVAWLIGGDQSPIDNSDAPWGYSVVSDDLDQGDLDETDNKTYVCRLETLAHELGHNMGQAHNTEDSDGTPGAHAYSYGYRESSLTGFYTVMAYRLDDSSQKAIRYFANPNVVEAITGRTTGIANASDNARSMAQTLPLIANFRPTMVAEPGIRPRNDINGDGRSDLLWRYLPGGSLQYWLMSGATRTSYTNVAQSRDFEHVANGDFNGDGRTDIAWRGPDNRVAIWLNNGAGFQKYSIGGLSRSWVPLDAVDINGDGKADLVWRYVPGGNIQYWFMSGATRMSYRNQAQSTAYQFLAAGDFNGDGLGDLAWRKADNRVAIWTGNGATFREASLGGLSRDWNVLDAIDINGDGRSDLVWRYKPGGNIQYWLMNGAMLTGYRNIAVSTSYAFLGTGDFDGDARGDLAWRRSDNRVAIWTGTGSSFHEASVSGLSTSWAVLNRGQ
jgi:peptidyl-Asp metalloendopeptidase